MTVLWRTFAKVFYMNASMSLPTRYLVLFRSADQFEMHVMAIYRSGVVFLHVFVEIFTKYRNTGRFFTIPMHAHVLWDGEYTNFNVFGSCFHF